MQDQYLTMLTLNPNQLILYYVNAIGNIGKAPKIYFYTIKGSKNKHHGCLKY
jgi:hypothetical protein